MTMGAKINYLIKFKKNHSEIPREFLEHLEFQPKTIDGFYLSRLALSELTERPLKIDSLKIKNHLHLENDNETLVSLSHTKGAAAAAIAKKEEGLISIGIDIERISRKLNINSSKYFLREEDEKSYSLLEIWCLKEAIFKAYAPFYQDEKTLVLKDFWITEDRFGHYSNRGKVLGKCNVKKEQGLYVAIATLLKI